MAPATIRHPATRSPRAPTARSPSSIRIRPDKYHVVETVTTPPGSRNMGLDPTTHRIYMPSGKFGATPSGRGRAPMEAGSFALLVIER